MPPQTADPLAKTLSYLCSTTAATSAFTTMPHHTYRSHPPIIANFIHDKRDDARDIHDVGGGEGCWWRRGAVSQRNPH